MFEWPPRDSAAAILDETEHLKRVAADLKKFEPPKRAPAPQPNYVTAKKLGRTLEGIGRLVSKAIREATEPLETRIRELEAREWLGVFEEGKAYSKGAIVTHDGSAWVATRGFPEAKPGAGADSGWRLIVKRGRDAKDAAK